MVSHFARLTPVLGIVSAKDCLCVFDIDRTLTGKQDDTQKCPANSIHSEAHDDAYGSGDLTLSELARRVSETFCGGCHLGIVSAGDASGDGSAERRVLHEHLAKADSSLPNKWSRGCYDVQSPLVHSCTDGQKQHAVKRIKEWYAQNAGAQIADSEVYFFDDRISNIEPFRNYNAQYNARQISCGTRNSDGSIGYCGATLSEIVPTRGVRACDELLIPLSDTTSEHANMTVAGHAHLTTLHWNIHRPCGTSNGACIAKAKQRVAAMAHEVGAKIVGTVELHGACSALPGWACSGTQCDSAAVMVAPGWKILKSGGACMNGHQSKGFAVALVQPAVQVNGCSNLCIVMGHVPHGSGSGTTGHDQISNVCGNAHHSCAIMMADWNVENIDSTWGALFHDKPTLMDPHEQTCCYPHVGVAYDHTGTNIPGAYSAGHKVYPFQLANFPSSYEHYPVSVQLRVPGAGSISSDLVV